MNWDSILSGEESGEPNRALQINPHDPTWSELGVLETGIEKIHLRRASLPAGRSGLWTSNFASPSRAVEVGTPVDVDGDGCVVTDHVECLIEESKLPRSLLPDERPHQKNTDTSSSDPAICESLLESSGLPFGLPARLPHRRESLPFNFPDRSRAECLLRYGRRESLPTDCSRSLNACYDVLPELNITSITPLTWKKEKRVSQSNCVQPATSVPSATPPDKSFGCVDGKENIVSTGYHKTVR